jgi:bifunctional N-acetylglucosamine-1-phosphate-uridyltransferase/glucosamine-1-phosphate-acetyltransferase GlmU-like protein
MTGYDGNKTLLPLIPGRSLYEGTRPLIVEVLDNLPPGPKAIVVNYLEEDVRRATANRGIFYTRQPVTNGTGGALLAARPFLDSTDADSVIITMGDVPFIRPATYGRLLELLRRHDLGLLGFECEDSAHYGMIEAEGERVMGIIEWKYWKDFPEQRLSRLKCCNAGVYAVRKAALLIYMDRMAGMPHQVRKHLNGEWVTIEEYFLTDLAEMMNGDGLMVGMTSAQAREAIGVDTPEALETAQELYAAAALPKLSDNSLPPQQPNE